MYQIKNFTDNKDIQILDQKGAFTAECAGGLVLQ